MKVETNDMKTTVNKYMPKIGQPRINKHFKNVQSTEIE